MIRLIKAEDKETFHIFNGSQTLNVKTLNIKNAQVTRSKIIIEFIIQCPQFSVIAIHTSYMK